MIEILVLITGLIILVYSSVKKDIVHRSIGVQLSLSLIASLIFTDRNELVIVIINIFIILMVTTLSYKKYEEKE